MMRRIAPAALCLVALTAGSGTAAAQDARPFVGRWALTIPGGGAGWLGITEDQGFLDGAILWGGGSVVPVDSVFTNHDNPNMVFVTRQFTVERKNNEGEVIRRQNFTEMLIGNVQGDTIAMTRIRPRPDGTGLDTDQFSGQRIPPHPPAPDLSQLQYGPPVSLIQANSLEGWRLTDANADNGWRVEDGVLINDTTQTEGQPRKRFGNLRTEAEFEDFNLTLETMVPENGNSGVYLRGIYEVQVVDSYGRDPNPHHMGAIYSRITPSVAAEKPAGEWQTLDITLCDRHVTVILNGTTIIDNAPLEGCTGGALWSDEFRPGPIYLQGDHTAAQFRNIVLRPIVKE